MGSMKKTAAVRPDLFRKWYMDEPDLSEFTKAERKELINLAKNLLE